MINLNCTTHSSYNAQKAQHSIWCNVNQSSFWDQDMHRIMKLQPTSSGPARGLLKFRDCWCDSKCAIRYWLSCWKYETTSSTSGSWKRNLHIWKLETYEIKGNCQKKERERESILTEYVKTKILDELGGSLNLLIIIIISFAILAMTNVFVLCSIPKVIT